MILSFYGDYITIILFIYFLGGGGGKNVRVVQSNEGKVLLKWLHSWKDNVIK